MLTVAHRTSTLEKKQEKAVKMVASGPVLQVSKVIFHPICSTGRGGWLWQAPLAVSTSQDPKLWVCSVLS